MKQIKNILFSMELMLILTLLFGIASAMGTFIENDYGTETAWAVIYTTKWFELIQILLAINLVGNIFKYNLFRKEKLPLLLFHGGFIVVLVGAAVTRYIGYEGIMHIREGQSTNIMRTRDAYIQIDAKKDGNRYRQDMKKYMSKMSTNTIELKLDVDGKDALLTAKQYIPNAKTAITNESNGIPMIDMMVLPIESKPSPVILKDNTIHNTGKALISLNKKIDQTDKIKIEFYTKQDKFYFISNAKTTWLKMSDNSSGVLEADKEYLFEPKKLYDFDVVKLVPKNMLLKAKKTFISDTENSNLSVLIADLLYDGKSKEIMIQNFGNGTVGKDTTVEISDVQFKLAWGSKLLELPFKIKLNDFELERYPGSMSPSSYSSKVTLIDEKAGVNMPFKIYMNHILDYKSHRFFQSSYDTDEKGTILSVNNDPGKIPTYIGYFLLTLGFILNILNPKSRFRKLASAIQKDTISRNISIFLIMLFTLNAPLHSANQIDKDHAKKFGDVLIQTQDGRVKSMDTFSYEVLLKLAKKSSIDNLNSNQIMLGMITDPKSWQDTKMIHIKHSKISNILGLGKKSKTLASFSDFFDYTQKTPYKLAKYIEESTHKSPIKRNEFDRQVIKTDERLSIAYMVYTGDLMNIVPKPNDINNKWYAVKEAIASFEANDSKMIRNLFINYFSEIDNAKKSNNWSDADKALGYIKTYQRKVAKDIIPTQSKIDAEKFFRKISLYNKLILVYLFAGIALLGIIMTKMLRPKTNISKASKIVLTIIGIAFALHTLGLAARWYIGGHAPWSNAYEAMLYVAWSMALAGLVFARYSLIAPALTGIITGVTLGATFLTEMDPQITNLVPVLKSYWLNIHVSVITASYGFLGLSMILGFFVLILFIFKNEKRPDLNRSIVEATRINEMTTILGISMLTIGNFLGGVWANESWGRYWGWDPKETWAWISILAYVVVLHIRFIPAIKKNYEYWYGVASTAAYGVIIMTFVGVNYYLSGMHSYAAGDPVPIPKYLYVIIAVVVAVIAIAYPKRSLKK